MNKVDRYKILIRNLISGGIAGSQQELGAMMGYNNASAFSQVINGKTTEPKNFTEKLKNLVPNLNLDWLETGEGVMLHEQNENNGGGQHFHGDINGNNPQFSGRDTINNPCPMGAELKDFIATLNAQVSVMTAQADLTKEAHELTRNAQAQVDKAQAQMDRLITMLEQKLNTETT